MGGFCDPGEIEGTVIKGAPSEITWTLEFGPVGVVSTFEIIRLVQIVFLEALVDISDQSTYKRKLHVSNFSVKYFRNNLKSKFSQEPVY